MSVFEKNYVKGVPCKLSVIVLYQEQT